MSDGSEILVYRYQLRSASGLNARSERRAFEGALLKIDGGVGCLHPWPELGDPTLDELLADVRAGRLFRPLVRSAVKCALVDGRARRDGVSLFDSVDVPRSHATVVGEETAVSDAVERGFDTVKLKVGRAVNDELALLLKMHEVYPQLQWRLDFNHSLPGGVLREFVDRLGEGLRGRIDFLEDPCRVGDRDWAGLRSLYGVPLAVDRGVESVESGVAQFRYAVVKPALHDVTPLCARAMMEGWRVVMTSYMDHPVGQCYAAWCAGKARGRFLGLVDDVCGLQTHGLFEPNAELGPFVEELGAAGPVWQAPGGTGVGFDDALNDLQWESL